MESNYFFGDDEQSEKGAILTSLTTLLFNWVEFIQIIFYILCTFWKTYTKFN